ncbi:hypothetical protein VOLCADRAFT_107184 [Volvox carteri f. nagariensis]|uniref:Uncharacterized protein n=1 Tax=Volvox carteri f. nagariensis TaxID=3068 RepID=D8UCH1_VOLCA|nr:uncharacterized protein VOLCADRAFT_107184 [Volvox carteri f. nagariensis]EFJ42550.1 hypothetical protein VOLCADRAFT_107184 [Volvox carteri f. nagariensis]|eukprot:XP_002956406.1 hypothetical protein VOLCADRAFT_107184 [Volvox carteri f. nagariensis]
MGRLPGPNALRPMRNMACHSGASTGRVQCRAAVESDSSDERNKAISGADPEGTVGTAGEDSACRMDTHLSPGRLSPGQPGDEDDMLDDTLPPLNIPVKLVRVSDLPWPKPLQDREGNQQQEQLVCHGAEGVMKGATDTPAMATVHRPGAGNTTNTNKTAGSNSTGFMKSEVAAAMAVRRLPTVVLLQRDPPNCVSTASTGVGFLFLACWFQCLAPPRLDLAWRTTDSCTQCTCSSGLSGWGLPMSPTQHGIVLPLLAAMQAHLLGKLAALAARLRKKATSSATIWSQS